MRTSAAVTARVLTAIVALLLLATGVVTLCWHWHVGWVRDRVARIDQSWFDRATQTAWWPWALLGVAVVAAIAGIACLFILLRPNRVADVLRPGSMPGRIALSVPDIAEAAAGELALDPRIGRASARTLTDGRREVLRISASVDELTAPSHLDELLDRVTAHTRAALGSHTIRVEYLLRVDRGLDQRRMPQRNRPPGWVDEESEEIPVGSESPGASRE